MTVTLEQFSGIVAGIYAAALGEERWEDTLRQMVSALGGSGGALLVAAPRARRFQYASVGVDQAAVTAHDAYYGRLDPVAAAIERSAAGTVLCGDDVIPRARHRRSEFHRDWATSLIDGGDGIYANLARDGDSHAWVGIAAPLGPEPFGSRSRMRLMRALVPHLQQAVRFQARQAEVDGQRRCAFDALDRTGHGMVLLDAAGRLLFANR